MNNLKHKARRYPHSMIGQIWAWLSLTILKLFNLFRLVVLLVMVLAGFVLATVLFTLMYLVARILLMFSAGSSAQSTTLTYPTTTRNKSKLPSGSIEA